MVALRPINSDHRSGANSLRVMEPRVGSLVVVRLEREHQKIQQATGQGVSCTRTYAAH